ncbi:ComF family protein [Thiohalobacter sp. IOR34]|uniref:ComF family protein n=1 Tax=Thiohalobacter sp. IOR34 TaxID=3057176 RepID=UPI0025AF2AF5|nr:ComF family protein [Thiohalobacter sp. IOR34]WJW75722.1 ComF family protein [Thiohalobacter sp. IOR34]
MVYNWLEALQLRLWVPHCLLCGGPGSDGLDLCSGCRRELPRPAAACPRCATPLPAGTGDRPCGRCLQAPPAFDAARAALLYRPPVDSLITGLKFATRLAHARLLGELLAERLAAEPRPDCILPVPLHPARQRQRGFNQAIEIARFSARRLGLPLELDSCRRLRATLPQSGLSSGDRRRNLRGAFGLQRPPAGRHIAILDDVMTTGSTADALARVLKAAGAERVELWVCARTPGHDSR